jgi:hypothetical protein
LYSKIYVIPGFGPESMFQAKIIDTGSPLLSVFPLRILCPEGVKAVEQRQARNDESVWE